IDHESGDDLVAGVMYITEGILGAEHSHDAEPGDVHALPASVVDLPAEHGFLAVDLGLAVGEARAGEDVGGASFDVVAGDIAGGKAGSERTRRSREDRGGGTQIFHPNSPSRTIIPERLPPPTVMERSTVEHAAKLPPP